MKTPWKNVVIINASGFHDTVSRDLIVLAPTPQGGLPILKVDRTVEERRHEERPRAVSPKVPVRDVEEDSDRKEYVIHRLLAYDA